MKKIALLFVSILFGTTVFFGQTGQTAEDLLKSKAKSDEEIQDAKKNIKSATWEKRADLFLEIAQFNTKMLAVGMPQTGITGAELLVGKPKDIKTNGVNEDWIYDRITLHFANGVLDSWDETSPLDHEALNKSFEAYNKAAELDPKGKFKSKSSVKANVMILRGLYVTTGVEFFGKKKYAEAVQYLDKALILAEYPRTEADTSFKVGLVTYYAGVMATSGKDYPAAEKYFTKCIDNGYEEGSAYSALATLYKEMGKSDKELETLQAGFKKYPESREVLVGFINFYLNSGQSDLALEKLNKAINDDPNNPTFHFAKATLYDNMTKDSTNKFTVEEKKTFLTNAIEGYKKSIEIKADYFEANYNIGALYFNEAVYKLKEADTYGIKQVKEFDAKVAEAKLELEKALPYMEKAHELDPTDRFTVQTLLTIYHRLQKYDKKKEMQEKLDKLPTKAEGL